MTARHVIIGFGVAGAAAAEAIREKDPRARITIYNGEPFPFYYRAAMSFYIKGAITEDELYARTATWTQERGVRVLNEKVAAVRPEAKEVVGESGMAEPYDSLLIATGAWPLVFPWPGAELEGVVTYRTLMCAKKTMDLVRKRGVKKAVVVGGGILGVELVEDLRNLGVETTLLVREERILELLFDAWGSALIHRQMEADGVRVALNTLVAEVMGDGGRVSAVKTDKGETIEAQMVGVAIGVKPFVEFLEGSGIDADRGVVVDETLRTNVDGVWAAGDVAVRKVGEEYIPCRTWLTAGEQGRVAGLNMAGVATEFREKVFFNASHAYNSIYAVIGRFGMPEGGGVRHVRLKTGADAYGKIIIENGKIAGGMLIGDVKAAWAVYRAIERGAEAPGNLDEMDWEGLCVALTGGPPNLF